MRQLDPSQLARLSDGERSLLRSNQEGDYIRYSNWVGGDMTDFHNYPYPKLPPAEPGKARVVGEYGGIGVLSMGTSGMTLPRLWLYTGDAGPDCEDLCGCG